MKRIMDHFDKLDRRNKFIVYKANPLVGFGNQFRAFCSVFLMAIVSNSRFRSIHNSNLSYVVEWDDYFKFMDSPLIKYKYSKEERNPINPLFMFSKSSSFSIPLPV